MDSKAPQQQAATGDVPQDWPAAAAATLAPEGGAADAAPALRDLLRDRRAARAARPVRAPWTLVVTLGVLLVLGFGVLALAAAPLRLPVWLVAEAEARLNRALGRAAGVGPVSALSLGGAQVMLDRGDWTPRLRLEDLRLLKPDGTTLVAVPEALATFDGGAALSGRARLASVRLIGAQVALRRLPDGSFDVALGGGMPPVSFDSLAAGLRAFDGFFTRPSLAALTRIEAEALTLTITDERAGRTWQLGDGRLTVEPRPDGVAAELGVSVVGGAETPARARAVAVTDRGAQTARLTLAVERVAAPDIARQAAGLAWLALVDAEVSGEATATVSLSREAAGLVGPIEAVLTLGSGALRPEAGGAPVAFERAALAFAFDPRRERLQMRDLTVESPTLRLAAEGHADLPGVTAGLPETAIVQVAVRDLKIDPEGLFATPAVFDGGGIDLRLRRSPFTVEIGRASLRDGPRRLTAQGRIRAEPRGWNLALDLALDRIDHRRIAQLWPLTLVPRTRAWFVANVTEGELIDLKGGLRLLPGAEPRLALSYRFAGADVRLVRGLPPIRRGEGYAMLEGSRYTLVLDEGRIAPPQGGALDVAGSVLKIADVTEVPAQGDIALQSRGTLTATLSLLDEDPFRYLQKAGLPVDLGDGTARFAAAVRRPLSALPPGAAFPWAAQGVIEGFRSTVLVPGRELRADRLAVTAGPLALRIAGDVTLDGVPFHGTLDQPLGREAGEGIISASFRLDADSAARLRLGLPPGALAGSAPAEVTVTLPRGAAPRLRMTSTLRGLGLRIPEIGWSKAPGSRGALGVEARLGAGAEVTRLTLDAPGLQAEGAMTTTPAGGLGRMRLDRLRVGDWLDGTATLTGRGAAAPAVALTGGRVDLRRLPDGMGGGDGAGAPLALALDRVQVSDGLALTGVAADLTTRGGLQGSFRGQVNGGPAVSGRLDPAAEGTAISVTGADAGGVLSAAGVFPNARGGTLSLRLVPQGAGYAGRIEVRDVRVRNTPVIAELINAVSVVGLLDQLNGQGLYFSDAEADFRLTAAGVDVRRGSAIGASLGVSMAGIYDFGRERLDMRGVVSPVYLLNAIGSVLTRRGEGLFGFNYRLTGTPDDPQVSVNPLSILTPGMFREIFRAPPPRITEGGG
jgi:hypothetical protein